MPFWRSEWPRNALSRCHSPHGDKKILRLFVERNSLQLDPVVDDGQGIVPEHFGLRAADANRETAREVIAIVFVQLFFNIRVGDQRGRLCKRREIRG